MLLDGRAQGFHVDYFLKGHGPTGFFRWAAAARKETPGGESRSNGLPLQLCIGHTTTRTTFNLVSSRRNSNVEKIRRGAHGSYDVMRQTRRLRFHRSVKQWFTHHVNSRAAGTCAERRTYPG